MSSKDILYLKEECFSATIITNDSMGKIYSIKSEINSIAKGHFISLPDYKKLVRKGLGLKNKIPIYFSDKLMLFNVKSDSCSYWINYFNILKICYNNEIIVIFKTGYILRLNTNKKIIINELTKVKKILDYLAKI